jgi:hypothetical protein
MAGFGLGVFGSWLLRRLRKPKILISRHALKGQHNSYEGKTVYRIKVINKCNRLINLEAHASVQNISGNGWFIDRELPLRISSHCLGGRRSKHSGEEHMPSFCFLILHQENLEATLSEKARLVFSVQAKDALSGAAVVRRMSYGPSDIQTGSFEHGLSLEWKQDGRAPSNRDPAVVGQMTPVHASSTASSSFAVFQGIPDAPETAAFNLDDVMGKLAPKELTQQDDVSRPPDRSAGAARP